MCVIAGYIGKNKAAPILLEMIKKEEGFFGGYYTGIATISDGKLYYAKLTGDADRLERLTDALNLPGNIGIIHSRTDFGGDDNWAHPFVSDDEKMAYVANGCSGIFADTTDYVGLAQMLEAEGFEFSSKAAINRKGYPMLKDKKRVHVSECNAHGIAYFIRQGLTPLKAMEKIFCEYPTEIVGLMIHAATSDRIYVSRVNQPMMVGFSENECFLSTTSMAFPNDREISAVQKIPENSACEVFVDKISISPFRNPPGKVMSITPAIWHSVYTCICSRLEENQETSYTFQELEKIVSDILPQGIKQIDVIVYEVIRELINNGAVIIVKTKVNSQNTGLAAPGFRIRKR